jgi:hypothetical protein
VNKFAWHLNYVCCTVYPRYHLVETQGISSPRLQDLYQISSNGWFHTDLNMLHVRSNAPISHVAIR